MIAYIIVSWNCKDDLERCLKRLVSCENVIAGRDEVIVVDNASSDGTREMLESHFLSVKKHFNSQNEGFARACNQGEQLASCEFLVFLNPDTEPCHSFARSLAATALSHPKYPFVAVGPTFLSPAGISVPTSRLLPSRVSIIVPSFLERHGSASLLEAPKSKSIDVPQLIGAAILMKREVFIQLGKFDEQYFVYYEEVDLCQRLLNLGGSCVQSATASLVHKGQASSSQIRVMRQYYLLRSKCLYARKHFGCTIFCATFFVAATIDPMTRALVSLVQSKLSDSRQYLAVGVLLWRWMLRSRAGNSAFENRSAIA